jgi:SH3-like domain-containing protein
MAKVIRHVRVATVLVILSGCAAVPGADDPRLAEANLTPGSRQDFRSYLGRPPPKAFAVAPTTGQSWHAWGYPTAAETQQVALSGCEALGNPCELFAIDNEIVWQAAPVATEPARPLARAASTVNIRRGPGTSHAVIGSLSAGSEVEAGAVSGSWTNVTLPDGREGWVASRFLERVGTAALPTAPVASGPRLAPDELAALRRRAEGGDVDAQLDLGNRYTHGVGVERDLVEARLWLTAAADQGSPLAAYELGLMYEFGRGVEANPAEARRWYAVGAREGHAPSRDRAAALAGSG